MTLEQLQLLTDHEAIRAFTEDRGGRPVTSGARLELAFGGVSAESAAPAWDEWFRRFDESGLALRCDPAAADSFVYDLVPRTPTASAPMAVPAALPWSVEVAPTPVVVQPVRRRAAPNARPMSTTAPRRKAVPAKTIARAPARRSKPAKPAKVTKVTKVSAKPGARPKQTVTTLARRRAKVVEEEVPAPKRRAPATVRARSAAQTVSADRPARKAERVTTARTTRAKVAPKTAPKAAPRGRPSPVKPRSPGSRSRW